MMILGVLEECTCKTLVFEALWVGLVFLDLDVVLPTCFFCTTRKKSSLKGKSISSALVQQTIMGKAVRSVPILMDQLAKILEQ